MNRVTHLRVAYGLSAFLFCTAAYLLVKEMPKPARDQETVAMNTPTEFDPLLASLRSRNLKPSIMRIKDSNEDFPFAAPWYGWSEQQRVQGVVAKVLKSPSDGLLKSIVAYRNEDLYCFTLMTTCAGDDTGPWVSARNWSVGEFCNWVAKYYLAYPANEATKRLRTEGMKPHFADENAEYVLKKIGRGDCRDFWQLQEEVCRRTIDDLPSTRFRPSGDHITEDILESCQRELESTISNLEKYKRGIFGELEFPSGSTRYYQEADTPRIMKLLNKVHPDNIETVE